MKELAALAKKNPGRLTFALTASGQQLAGELFKPQTGTDLLHVRLQTSIEPGTDSRVF